MLEWKAERQGGTTGRCWLCRGPWKRQGAGQVERRRKARGDCVHVWGPSREGGGHASAFHVRITASTEMARGSGCVLIHWCCLLSLQVHLFPRHPTPEPAVPPLLCMPACLLHTCTYSCHLLPPSPSHRPDLFLATPPQLCRLASSLPPLRLRPSPAWLEHFANVARSKMYAAGTASLASWVWALARLGYHPGGSPNRVLRSLYIRVSVGLAATWSKQLRSCSSRPGVLGVGAGAAGIPPW